MQFRVFPVTESPGYIIHCTDMLMKSGLTRALKANGYDITPEQWGVLSRLWETEGLNQRELADGVSKDRPNITRMLNVMEKGGLIRREQDPSDKRSLRVYLTEEGRNLQQKLTSIVIDLLELYFQGLPEQTVQDFLNVHRKIINNIKSLK